MRLVRLLLVSLMAREEDSFGAFVSALARAFCLFFFLSSSGMFYTGKDIAWIMDLGGMHDTQWAGDILWCAKS